MKPKNTYERLADTVRIFHAFLPVFIILTMAAMIISIWLKLYLLFFIVWSVVLTGAMITILGNLFLSACPLTMLEELLRKKADPESNFSYDGSFISYILKLFKINMSPRTVFVSFILLLLSSVILGTWLAYIAMQ